jgi:hypothetical protein
MDKNDMSEMRISTFNQNNLIFPLIILMLGIQLNFFVSSANGYRMPIKVTESPKVRLPNHLYYTYDFEINYPWLSDWIGFQSKHWIVRCSFGDLLIAYSVILISNELAKTILKKYK